MRGILIDPYNRQIDEIEIPESTLLKTLYATIGCDLVTTASLDENNDVWLDDEGLLTARRAFVFKLDYSGTQTFAGRGIVLAHDGHGNTISTTLSLLDVADRVVDYLMLRADVEEA